VGSWGEKSGHVRNCMQAPLRGISDTFRMDGRKRGKGSAVGVRPDVDEGGRLERSGGSGGGSMHNL